MATIAVVLKGYPRLSETFIAQELLALERAGFDLRIASLRHPTDKRRHAINDLIQAPVNYLPEYLRDEPWRVVGALLRQCWRPRFWRATLTFANDYRRDRTVNRLRRFGQATVLASELEVDVKWLYAHFIHTPGSVARYAAVMRNLPFSLSAHAKDIWTIPEWEIREKLLAARWTVCCTQSYCDKLASTAPTASVHLLYHGVDLSRYPPPSHRPRNDLRLQIASVARAVEKKGLDTLLLALAELPASLDWHFSHVGGGPELPKLQEMSRELGVADRIDWLGPRDHDDVIAIIQKADVFCLPARLASDGDRDGLPNVLMEAYSQAVPVIASDVGGIAELVDETCGILIPSDDPESLARAIAKLARSPVLRTSMGKAGRGRLAQRFDFQRNVSALVRRLEQSLGQ